MCQPIQLGDGTTTNRLVPTLIPNIRVSTAPSTDSVASALELINQLPDVAEKTEFLNRGNAVQTQISVNKVTELTAESENIVNSGSVDGLDEILLEID